MLISDKYRELNAKLHETRPDYGAGHSTRQWYPHIEAMSKSLNAASILDYGAGKGMLGHSMPHLMVENYDPAVPHYNQNPDQADLVVCTDVMEHIEPECLDAVLDDIRRLSIKGVFLTVATRPAVKTLEDGRNAHLIQQNADWWLPKLTSRWEIRLFQADAGEFVFFGLARQANAVRAAA